MTTILLDEFGDFPSALSSFSCQPLRTLRRLVAASRSEGGGSLRGTALSSRAVLRKQTSPSHAAARRVNLPATWVSARVVALYSPCLSISVFALGHSAGRSPRGRETEPLSEHGRSMFSLEDTLIEDYTRQILGCARKGRDERKSREGSIT